MTSLEGTADGPDVAADEGESIVTRLFAIQAEYERDEAENEDAPTPAPGPPAITFDMAGEHIGFRDQAALDEYVMGALDAEPCPQGIHGWRQRTPNNLCPWCEWEDDRQRLAAVTAQRDQYAAQVARVEAVLDAYAPIARRQRGCADGCGCTDCEMVEDVRAALRADGGGAS